MNPKLANVGNMAQIGGFLGFVLLTIWDRWSLIRAAGQWFPKIAFGFLCLAIIGSAISAYYTRYYTPPVKPPKRTGKQVVRPTKSRIVVRPLLIGLVITLLCLLSFVIYQGLQGPPEIHVATMTTPVPEIPTEVIPFQDVPPKIQVLGKTFHNERIPLDGYSYVGCTFHDCMFEYKGTAAFQVTGCRIYGRKKISTGDNKSLAGLMLLLRGFELVDMDFGERESIPPLSDLQEH